MIDALIASVAIIGIGARSLLAPRQAMLGCGVPSDGLRALTEIKGVRDITSGVVKVVVGQPPDEPHWVGR